MPTTEPHVVTTAPPAPTTAAGPATEIAPGTYVVGVDIAAGTYRTKGPADSRVPFCYWARLKDTSGNIDAITANGNPQGPTTVTVAATDKAFETSGCSTWTKVG
ncbi:hypothetical protein F0L68_26105 [Solihabitans fulvus]|uniref:Uncharacterized protein n=1 Tax=Solihabitans fulvus TaxID=1892852 RepID=A0A5B2X109_9PSEU|nr:hypothetical protein [Solihabitans fulvus]KAA2256729.1 hypothetical protein F0L68_26105 [Solihabitans fulvus]